MIMILLTLFMTGLLAGTVDAIAGGGGLISLPVLLSVGIPPHVAFGTNKLQGSIGTCVAALKYYRHGFIKMSSIYYALFFGVLGGIAGSVAAQILSSDVLRKIIPVLLFIILIYTICSPRLGQLDKKSKMNETWFYFLFGTGLAFYDGFFGPGTGSFWVFALTFFLGHNLIKATAYTKIFNLNSSLIATICFAIGGNIDYRFGLTMAAGSLIGGRLGAHLAITKGAKLIRPIFLSVVSVTIITLLYKNYVTGDVMKRVTLINSFQVISFVFIATLTIASAVFIYTKSKRINAER